VSTEPEPVVDVRRLATRAGIGVLLLVDLLVVLAGSHSPLANPDTFFHVRFGEEFLHHWSIAHPGQPNAASSAHWVPTQWLSQVVWAVVYDHAGRVGMSVLFAVLLTGVLVTSYAAARTGGSVTTSVVAATLVLVGGQHWMGLRPQLVSYILIAVTVIAWNRVRETRRTPWLLIPLTWVWAMCHGMWVLGVAIGVVAVVGLAIEQRDLSLTLRRLAVPILSLVAAALTPVGPRLLAAVLLVNSRASHFSEWQPVPSLRGWGVPVTIVVAVVVVLRMRRGSTSAYPLAMTGLAAIFALYSGRTVVAALIVAAPLLAAELRRSRRAAPSRRAEAAGVAIVCVAGLVVGLVGSTHAAPGLPARLTPFTHRLRALPAGTVMLTDHTEGALLLWAYPRLEVPLHGYGDVFTDAELDRYDDLSALRPGWASTLRRLDARYALLPHDDSLAYALTQIGWRVVQRSAALQLLVGPGRASSGTSG